MNKILLIALLCTATFANAGKYSDAVATQQACESFGNMAKAAYGVKNAGISLTEFQANVKPEWEQMKKDIAIAGYHSKDAHSAYMAGWATCMDN